MNAALHRPALRAARAVVVTGAPTRTVLEAAMAADQAPFRPATAKGAGVV